MSMRVAEEITLGPLDGKKTVTFDGNRLGSQRMRRILLVHGPEDGVIVSLSSLSCMSATAAAASTVSYCATSSSRIRQKSGTFIRRGF